MVVSYVMLILLVVNRWARKVKGEKAEQSILRLSFPLFLFLSFISSQPAWSAGNDWIWSRRLDEIGFDDGVAAAGHTDTLTVFWSVPDAARRGDASLDLAIGTLVPPHFSGQVCVLVDGMPAGSVPITTGTAEAAIHLAVSRGALRDGHVRIDLTAVEDEQTSSCAGQARSVALALLPQSTLRIALAAPPSDDAALTLLPATVTARIPADTLTAQTFRNVVVIAAALARTGHRVVFTAQESGNADLVFTPTGTRITTDGPGRVTIPAIHPIADAIAAYMPPVPVTGGDDPAVALGALGVTTAAQIATHRADWTFALPLRSLPVELVPRALRVELTAPVDGDGARHMLTLRVNDQLVASRLLTLSGAARVVTLPIAPGALDASNVLQLSLTRVGIEAVCGAIPLPVSLGPGSLVVLAPVPAAPHQFYEFARLAPDEMTLWIEPAALTAPERALAFALALVTSSVRELDRLAVRVIDRTAPGGTAPFLYLAHDPPPGFAGDVVPSDDSRESAAMLVRAGTADGIWLRPGTTPDRGRAVPPLSRGHAARFADNGDLYWYNNDLASGRTIWSAQGQQLAEFVKHYWPWTAALLWLGTGAALLVARIQRRGPLP